MRSRILGIASIAGIAVALYFALVYAPTEQTMGVLQRVFYFHLPQAILSYVAAFLLAALFYLSISHRGARAGLVAGQG